MTGKQGLHIVHSSGFVGQSLWGIKLDGKIYSESELRTALRSREEPYVESDPGEHQVVLDALEGCNSGESE